MPATRSMQSILLVINTLKTGGAERFMVALSNWLAARDVRVSLAVFDDGASQLVCDPRVDLICLRRRGAWDVWRVVSRLRDIIRSRRPSAVLTTLTPVTLHVALAYVGLASPPPRFARECVHYSSMLPAWQIVLYRCLFRFAFHTCRAIICQAHAMLEDLRDNFGVPAAKLTVIHNPVDIERCRRMAQADIQHPYLTSRDLPVIVSCAKLASQKDYSTLLRALARLHAQGRPCRLIALGEGPERSRLEQLRAELGLRDYIDFHGVVDNPYAYMARADVFVLASHYEGFPNVVIEAMACGAPVVCTDCQSGPREIITHGETGLLVPPRDPAALAHALARLLDDPQLRHSLPRNALNQVRCRYDLDQICQQYYQILCAPPPAPLRS